MKPPTAVIVVVLLALGLGFSAPYFPDRFSDVRAFYCAGQALRDHADPYREHPLSECERRVAAPGLSQLRNDVTVPAPFPGVVLALFALLAALPFGWALALWMALTCAAIGVAVLLLARVTRTPITAAAILCGFPAAVVALPLGQLTPLVFVALAASAALLEASRPRWAAVAALGTLLEPHVGVAVVLGLACGMPKLRWGIAAGLSALAVGGVAVCGVGQEAEYLRAVLPAHALANVADATQFSTTHFAYVIGAPGGLAVMLGGIWYVVSLGVGTLVALRVRRQLGRAALVLVPPAFAVFGGTHTHLAQLALAVPAFMLVCARTTGRSRVVFTLALFVAATPWLLIGAFPLLFIATVALAIVFAYTMRVEMHALRLGAATFFMLGAIFIAIIRSHIDRAIVHVQLTGNPLAEVGWQMWMLARNVPPEPWYLFAKAPTVIAFSILLGVLVRTAFRRRALGAPC
jgi:hypothetical protein